MADKRFNWHFAGRSMVVHFNMLTGYAIIRISFVKNSILALQREIILLSRLRKSLRKKPILTYSVWLYV